MIMDSDIKSTSFIAPEDMIVCEKILKERER